MMHENLYNMYDHIHYSLQYLRCPKKNALKDKSSIFGQTGISCLSVRVIDFFVAGPHALSFSAALCKA